MTESENQKSKPKMTDAEYSATQIQLLAIGRMVNVLNLDGFIQRVELAEAMGPILNPTLYREGMGNLDKIKRLAQAARKYQAVVREVVEEARP